MSNFKLHTVKFYRPNPNAIFCLSLNESKTHLALSRFDGSLEIWNIVHCPLIEGVIYSSTESNSIEEICWINDSVFSVGLHGLLVEYNLRLLNIKSKTSVVGGAAHCLDVFKKELKIIVGTQNGYINVFQLTSDGPQLEKCLDKQDGIILCIKYDCTGQHIVSGGEDFVRIWNVETGHVLHKMSTGRSEANKSTIIWCLQVTNDFTIITGDSRGKLTFWDGKLGAQVESFQTHKADILSLCLSADQSSLYCSGADPTISNYVKIFVKNENPKWVKHTHKKLHEHDVRALVSCDEKLFSGGIDGCLTCSYTSKLTLKYPPIPQHPVVISCEARYIMLRHLHHLEVWSLADLEESEVVRLKSKPKKLLVLQTTAKESLTKSSPESIIFYSISNDGKWIVYGTNHGVKLYQFIYEQDNGPPQLLNVETNFDNQDLQLLAKFTSDNSKLLTISASGLLHIYALSSNRAALLQSISIEGLKSFSKFLFISDDQKFLVVSDSCANIVTYSANKSDSWKLYNKLPVYSSAPAAMSLHPKTNNLMVVYADNKILEYDIIKKTLTKFSRNVDQMLPTQWSTRVYPIKNITFDLKSDRILLHDDYNIIAINKSKIISENVEKISRKQDTTIAERKVYSFQHIRKQKHLAYLSMLSENELVAVEVKPISLLEQLPPILFRNKFGTK